MIAVPFIRLKLADYSQAIASARNSNLPFAGLLELTKALDQCGKPAAAVESKRGGSDSAASAAPNGLPNSASSSADDVTMEDVDDEKDVQMSQEPSSSSSSSSISSTRAHSNGVNGSASSSSSSSSAASSAAASRAPTQSEISAMVALVLDRCGGPLQDYTARTHRSASGFLLLIRSPLSAQT